MDEAQWEAVYGGVPQYCRDMQFWDERPDANLMMAASLHYERQFILIYPGLPVTTKVRWGLEDTTLETVTATFLGLPTSKLPIVLRNVKGRWNPMARRSK